MQPVNNLQNIHEDYFALRPERIPDGNDKSLETSRSTRIQAVGKQISNLTADQSASKVNAQENDWEILEDAKNGNQKASELSTKINDKPSIPAAVIVPAITKPTPQPQKKEVSGPELSAEKDKPINNLQKIQDEYFALRAAWIAGGDDEILQTSLYTRMQALGKQIADLTADPQNEDQEIVEDKNGDQKTSAPSTKADDKPSIPVSSTTDAITKPIFQPKEKEGSFSEQSAEKEKPINDLQKIQDEYFALRAVWIAGGNDESLQTSLYTRLQELGKQIADLTVDPKNEDREMVEDNDGNQKANEPSTKVDDKPIPSTAIAAADFSTKPFLQPKKKEASFRGLSAEQVKFIIEDLGVDPSAKTYSEVQKEFVEAHGKFNQLRSRLDTQAELEAALKGIPLSKPQETPEIREAQRNLDRASVRRLLHPYLEDVVGPDTESEKLKREFINDLMAKDRTRKNWLKFEAKYLLPITELPSKIKTELPSKIKTELISKVKSIYDSIVSNIMLGIALTFNDEI